MHHEMKFSPVILVFTLVIVLVTAQSGELSGEFNEMTLTSDCNSNDWTFTNITAKWNNGTKHIEAIIIYNKPGRPIYKIRIIIDDCKNHTSCSGRPQIYITPIDCRPNKIESLPESDKAACEFAEEARNRGKENKWLITRYHPLLGKKLFDTLCTTLDESSFDDNLEYNLNQHNSEPTELLE